MYTGLTSLWFRFFGFLWRIDRSNFRQIHHVLPFRLVTEVFEIGGLKDFHFWVLVENGWTVWLLLTKRIKVLVLFISSNGCMKLCSFDSCSASLLWNTRYGIPLFAGCDAEDKD